MDSKAEETKNRFVEMLTILMKENLKLDKPYCDITSAVKHCQTGPLHDALIQKDVDPDVLSKVWEMAGNFDRRLCDNLDQKMCMYILGDMYKKEHPEEFPEENKTNNNL